MRLKTLIVAVCVSGCIHNGSVSRNSLPLRKDGRKDLQILLSD